MKTAKILTILVVALGLILCSAKISKAPPILMGSAFTYQGHLYDANDVANGEYDFEFKLYKKSMGGSTFQVGSAIDVNEVDVIDGYFTVELDFNSPDAFNGNALWLEIGVRPGDMNDPNVYTALSPWQEVTPTPYALYAASTGAVPVPLNLSGTSPVIKGTHSGSGSYGTLGNDGIGVFGSSSSGNGVHGSSSSGKGVYGVSSSGTGGYFKSISGYGLVVETGNVGIGTTSPSEALDVNGTVEATAFVGDGSGLTGIATGDSDWTISGPNMYTGAGVTGNVGIGTTSPGSKLSVSGQSFLGDFISSNTWGVLRLYEGATMRTFLGFGDATAILINALSDSTALVAATGGLHLTASSDALNGITVATSGNVGIGTTGPTAKLEVIDSSYSPIISGTNTGTGYAGNFGQTGSSNSNGGLNVTTAAGRYGAKILNQGGYSGASFGLMAEATSANNYTYGGFFKAETGGDFARGIFINADNTKASGGASYGIQLDSASYNGSATGLRSSVWASSPGNTSNLYGIYSSGSHSGTSGTSYGMKSYIHGSDTGDSYGIYSEGNKWSSDTAGNAYGGYFVGDNDRPGGKSYGLYTKVANNSGSYGLYVDLDPGSYGYGVYAELLTTTANTNNQYGLLSTVSHQGTGGFVYGVQSSTYSSNSGNNYAGYFSAWSNSGDTGDLYGIFASCDNDTSGSKYAVYANGPSGGYDFYAGGPGTNYGWASSVRWKSDIRPIDDPLGKVLQLRGVYFNWDAEHGGGHEMGMIAEEVGEVLPEIVGYEENGIDATGMDYGKVTPLLVEAVKALKVEANEREKQQAEKDVILERLQEENQVLSERLAAIESLVEQIAVERKGLNDEAL